MFRLKIFQVAKIVLFAKTNEKNPFLVAWNDKKTSLTLIPIIKSCIFAAK